MTQVIVTCQLLPGTMQILLFGADYKYFYLLTYLVEYSIRYSTEYSSSKRLDSHTLHISRHLEFIIEQGLLLQCFDAVDWAAGRASGL